MQTTMLLVVKIALLVVLWFFIWMAIRSLRADARRASGLGGAAAYVDAAGPAPGYVPPSGGLGLRRARPPAGLVVTTGPLTGTQLDFVGYSEIIIGRAPGSTLVLEDDFASGSHARLIRRGSQWYVEDLDSRNGTWLGDQRLDQPELLTAGMDVRVGQTHLRMDA